MCIHCLRGIVAALISAMTLTGSPLAAEPVALPKLNAAIGDSSISGISSGAFMAVQFATAWSSVIRGVGVVAGGPYWCAEADMDDALFGFSGPVLRALGACMTGRPPSDLTLADFTAKADAKARSGEIDPLENIGRQKIYLFHGTNDTIVARASTDRAADFYRHYLGGAASGNLFYQTAVGAGHSLVVRQDQQGDGLNDCDANASPYIDRCDNYDQAGIILQHIYGALYQRNPGQLRGKLMSFDQSIYTRPKDPAELSLGATGYVFVPDECAHGTPCRVHVALHGCAQDVGEASVGRRFVEDTGYNAWADTNHLIVLYPQTQSSLSNLQACWDWWSYVDHSDDYVTKSGPQIMAIKAMLDALTAGATPPMVAAAAPATAPAGITVIDTSDTSADLAWTPSAGITTYRVQRAAADGAFTAVADVTGFSFGDSGLKPQTAYRWHVSAVVNGVEGPASTDVSATTRATPAPCDTPGTCPINP
jgi:poly(3-hydroxybutyrate) depolymerase